MKIEERIFHNTLTGLEKSIEEARQNEQYLIALGYTNRAIGIICYTYYCMIIDNKEFELLFSKFLDYRAFYTGMLK